MKDISNALQAHIESEVTTLATCWKLTRRDGTVMGFADHDKDILFEAVTYRAATGFSPSALASNSSLSVDNMEVEGMLADGSITEADIMAGKYDFAEIEIFQVNYRDLTQGALKLRRGWLGEVSHYKQQFVAEVRGLSQRLSQTIGELYSPSCRASFADGRCGLNAADFTHTGSVTDVLSRQEFYDGAATQPTGRFNGGKITFTSGANDTLSMEIKEYTYTTSGGGRFVLALPMPFSMAEGDEYAAVQGCDKTLATCSGRFDNVVNFRGEPFVPGIDKMLETAGTRSS